jgi:hypothetical protein
MVWIVVVYLVTVTDHFSFVSIDSVHRCKTKNEMENTLFSVQKPPQKSVGICLLKKQLIALKSTLSECTWIVKKNQALG